jgi:hypothetical protein
VWTVLHKLVLGLPKKRIESGGNYLGELTLAEFRLFTHFVCLEAQEKLSGPALRVFTVSSLSYTTNRFALLKHSF